MKRFVIIVIVCLIGHVSFGQDRVRFRDEEFKEVEIIKVDSANALIEYKVEGKNLVRAIRAFDEIIYQGEKLNLDYWTKKEETTSEQLTNKALLRSNPYSYGEFAVSSNLTSFLGSSLRRRNSFFYDNLWFSIEPEYWFNDRFSVKFPILIGLNSKVLNEPAYLNLENSSWRYYVAYVWEEGVVAPPKIEGPVENYYLYDDGVHKRNLEFQLGINPKFYLTTKRRVMPYIGQSFNVGFVNLKVIDYYSTFNSEVDAVSGETFYTFQYEEQYVRNGQSLVFKYEGMFGLNFNLTRGLNFTTEVGYSNRNKAVNDEVDRVYLRTDPTEDFKLVETRNYSADVRYSYGLRGRLFARVHLVYRFGGVRNKVD